MPTDEELRELMERDRILAERDALELDRMVRESQERRAQANGKS